MKNVTTLIVTIMVIKADVLIAAISLDDSNGLQHQCQESEGNDRKEDLERQSGALTVLALFFWLILLCHRSSPLHLWCKRTTPNAPLRGRRTGVVALLWVMSGLCEGGNYADGGSRGQYRTYTQRTGSSVHEGRGRVLNS